MGYMLYHTAYFWAYKFGWRLTSYQNLLFMTNTSAAVDYGLLGLNANISVADSYLRNVHRNGRV